MRRKLTPESALRARRIAKQARVSIHIAETIVRLDDAFAKLSDADKSLVVLLAEHLAGRA